jgi:hypothetical protein
MKAWLGLLASLLECLWIKISRDTDWKGYDHLNKLPLPSGLKFVGSEICLVIYIYESYKKGGYETEKAE